MRSLILLSVQLAAALVPLLTGTPEAMHNATPEIDWPSEIHGKKLSPLPMTEQERGFSQGFPGEIRRFSDGQREIIIRHITRASRKLHASADCLRGSGFQIQPQPIRRELNGQLWGCVKAERNGNRYRICERIYNAAEQSWYDVSSWYWSALLQNTQGPWWAITIATPI